MTENKSMDRKSWIASRTDNPNKLGRKVWNAVYDALNTKNVKVPIEIEKEMLKEYLIKRGLSCNLEDPNQFSMAQTFFRVPIELPKESIQNVFDAIIELKDFIGNRRIL